MNDDHNVNHTLITPALKARNIKKRSKPATDTTDGDGINRDRLACGLTIRKSREGSMTRNACTPCRKRKIKCNGVHPICARCAEHQEECTYDVPREGMTRLQHIQQELHTNSGRYNDLLLLFEVFRTGSDGKAAHALARLRMGEPLDTIASSLQQYCEEPVHSPESYYADTSPPTLSPTLALPSAVHSALFAPSFGWDQMNVTTLPEVNDGADMQDARLYSMEAARMRKGHSGMPQVSFGGIEWPLSPFHAGA